jgi:hypothetical protein
MLTHALPRDTQVSHIDSHRGFPLIVKSQLAEDMMVGNPSSSPFKII